MCTVLLPPGVKQIAVNNIHTHTHTHTHTHRVIQEKRPIFWEVTTCHCEKIRSHKHVSKSEWLPRYSCLNVARTVLPSLFCPDPTPLDVCLWGLMNSEVYERKVDILDKLVTRILDAAARIKNVKITETNNTRSSHASCKVHYSWRWVVRTFIVNCNKFVI